MSKPFGRWWLGDLENDTLVFYLPGVGCLHWTFRETLGAVAFALDDTPAFSEFTNLFDQYKIVGA